MFNKKIKRIYVIAEAGVNHNGKLEVAKKLIINAKKAGANAIKFQIFKAQNLATQNSKKAEYKYLFELFFLYIFKSLNGILFISPALFDIDKLPSLLKI